MIDKLKPWEVWIFLCLIVCANTIFIAAIGSETLSFRFYNLGRFVVLGLVLVAVVYVFRRTEGLRGLIRPMSVWQVHPGWYLLALCWASLICIITLSIKSLMTGNNEFVLSFEVVSRLSIMRTILIASFIGEIVWVSYAIGRLSQKYSMLEASVIVGAFWALWWTPIVIFGKGVIPSLPLDALLLNMLGVAVMCGFVYAKTRSGLVVLLLQFMLNSSILVFPVLPTTGGDSTYWMFGAIYLSSGVLLHGIFGPHPLLSLGQRSRQKGS